MGINQVHINENMITMFMCFASDCRHNYMPTQQRTILCTSFVDQDNDKLYNKHKETCRKEA